MNLSTEILHGAPLGISFFEGSLLRSVASVNHSDGTGGGRKIKGYCFAIIGPEGVEPEEGFSLLGRLVTKQSHLLSPVACPQPIQVLVRRLRHALQQFSAWIKLAQSQHIKKPL